MKQRLSYLGVPSFISWLEANPSQELWGCINARNPSRAPAPAATRLSPRRHKPSCPHQCACSGCHDLCQRLLGARLRRWIRADFLSLVRPSVSHPRMLCSLLLFLPSRPQLPAAGPCCGGGGDGWRGAACLGCAVARGRAPDALVQAPALRWEGLGGWRWPWAAPCRLFSIFFPFF